MFFISPHIVFFYFGDYSILFQYLHSEILHSGISVTLNLTLY